MRQITGIIYASLQTPNPGSNTRNRLTHAVQSLLSTTESNETPSILWSLSYISTRPESHENVEISSNPTVIRLPDRPFSISLEDDILDDVKAAWEAILGDEAEGQTFMRFAEREQEEVDGFS